MSKVIRVALENRFSRSKSGKVNSWERNMFIAIVSFLLMQKLVLSSFVAKFFHDSLLLNLSQLPKYSTVWKITIFKCGIDLTTGRWNWKIWWRIWFFTGFLCHRKRCQCFLWWAWVWFYWKLYEISLNSANYSLRYERTSNLYQLASFFDAMSQN